MDATKNALVDVMIHREQFINASVNSKVGKRKLDVSDVDEFLKSLERLYATIQPNRNYKKFVQKNNKQLYDLRSTLISTDSIFYEQSYTENLLKKMTAMYRRIFIGIKYNQNIEKLEHEVTTTFTEFTKGITYFDFEFQPNRSPIYHRDASCGSSGLKSYQRFVKTLYGPQKNEYIKRCLIERLIYDRLYEDSLRLQDLEHKYELQEVNKLYEKYFPNMSLRVKVITYDKDSERPNYVSIEYHNKIGLAVREEYSKPNDDGVVYCHKRDFQNDEYFEKMQTFSSNSVWNKRPLPVSSQPRFSVTFE